MFDAFDPLKGKMLRILDEQGRLLKAGQKYLPDLSPAELCDGYAAMVRARVADERAVSYQRQGRIYTLPTNLGQEAAAVGSILALRPEDWMVQSYRELGGVLAKGGTVKNHLAYFSGSETGSVHPGRPRLLPLSVPITSQVTHAAGIGHSIVYRGGSEVVITFFGDGGTSQGDFNEGLNWAAVFKCPVIFVCNNNQYAISLGRKSQTGSETLAQKAIAFGMPGMIVDGNDYLAVVAATRAAAEHARAGRGPVLLEMYTYRMGAHTTSDDPSIYRSKEEEESWKHKDPLLRMRAYLDSLKLWDDAKEAELREQVGHECDQAMAEVEAMERTPIEDIFGYQYETMPPELVRQMAEYKQFLAWKEAR